MNTNNPVYCECSDFSTREINVGCEERPNLHVRGQFCLIGVPTGRVLRQSAGGGLHSSNFSSRSGMCASPFGQRCESWQHVCLWLLILLAFGVLRFWLDEMAARCDNFDFLDFDDQGAKFGQCYLRKAAALSNGFLFLSAGLKYCVAFKSFSFIKGKRDYTWDLKKEWMRLVLLVVSLLHSTSGETSCCLALCNSFCP